MQTLVWVAASAGFSAGFGDELDAGGEKYLAFAFVRPSGAAALSDVIYSAERATSLKTKDWSPAEVIVDSITPGPGPDRETVVMRSSHPVTTAAKEFLRLSVSLTP